MCAEAVWWRCHRRIITDYLISDGGRVYHIMGLGHIEPATLNPAAVRHHDGSLVYPAAPGVARPTMTQAPGFGLTTTMGAPGKRAANRG
jgi:hypothetical protein